MNGQMILFLCVTIFLTYWALKILLQKLAENDTFFTALKMNEYICVINASEGGNPQYFGYAIRKILYNIGGEEKTKTLHMKANRTAGKVEQVSELEFALQGFFLNHFGVIWIGLAGTVKRKSIDLKWYKNIGGGKIDPRNETVYSVFDSYGYCFHVTDAKTHKDERYLLDMNIQQTLFVDDLHEIFYGIKPAGSWTGFADGNITEGARSILSQNTYDDLITERDGYIKNADKTSLHKYFEGVTFAKRMEDLTGHSTGNYIDGIFVPGDFSILKFDLDQKEIDDLLQLARKNQLTEEANLVKEKVKVKIEEQKRLQEKKRSDAKKYYIDNVLKNIVSSGAQELHKVEQIATLQNLTVLNYNSNTPTSTIVSVPGHSSGTKKQADRTDGDKATVESDTDHKH